MTPSGSKTRRGFALVLTIGLLALLVLAVYALSALVRVNTQTATAGVAQMQARQNALVGLKIAQGELQRVAGPDAVVTGRSSVRAKTTANPALLGIWSANAPAADPINWMISGNFAPDSARSIGPLAVPAEASDVVTLVGENTVVKTTTGRNYARAKKQYIRSELGAQIGSYAFWVGDEGAKASIALPNDSAPVSGSGIPVIANPRGEVTSFSVTAAGARNIVSSDQLSFFIASGESLKSRFHDYTYRADWVSGGVYASGLFNINTTSEESWKAVLAAYDSVRPSGSEALGARYANVATSLTGLFANRTSSGGKVRQGPFISVDAFWASNLVADALNGAGVFDISQDEIRVALSPMLVVRSDTFRIRAFGEVLNPVDGTTVEAVAYCEAIVQRTPDAAPNGLGRRFVVTYFRWLGPSDI